jgi:hypothetical protein
MSVWGVATKGVVCEPPPAPRGGHAPPLEPWGGLKWISERPWWQARPNTF